MLADYYILRLQLHTKIFHKNNPQKKISRKIKIFQKIENMPKNEKLSNKFDKKLKIFFGVK